MKRLCISLNGGDYINVEADLVELREKWENHKNLQENMRRIVLQYGLLGERQAERMARKGYGCELNEGYFADAVGYLRAEDAEMEQPSLFDLLEQEAI